MARKAAVRDLIANKEYLDSRLERFYRGTPKSKRHTSGIDGLSLQDIGIRNNAFTKTLSKQLSTLQGKPGCYKHSPLMAVAIEKPHTSSKSHRIICIPTIKDRLVQKAINDFIRKSKIDIGTPISYGHDKKKTAKAAAKVAKDLRGEYQWVYKTDITSFFDQIPREILKSLIKKKIKYPSLYPLIFQVIDAEITTKISSDTRRIISEHGIKPGKGLRQGMPLSPLLANLFLKDFDHEVKNNGFKAIRYVDDLAFFCSSKEECIKAHAFCVDRLGVLGLNVPDISVEGKTKIYNPTTSADFLGLEIAFTKDKYSIQISQSQISKVYEKFNDFSYIEKNLDKGLKFSDLSRKLESIVFSYKGHYGEAENYDWFVNKLYKWKRHIYQKLLSNGLGVNLKTLTNEQKAFFHLIEMID